MYRDGERVIKIWHVLSRPPSVWIVVHLFLSIRIKFEVLFARASASSIPHIHANDFLSAKNNPWSKVSEASVNSSDVYLSTGWPTLQGVLSQ